MRVHVWTATVRSEPALGDATALISNARSFPSGSTAAGQIKGRMAHGHDGGKGLIHRVHRNHVHVLLVCQAELQEYEVAGQQATGGGVIGQGAVPQRFVNRSCAPRSSAEGTPESRQTCGPSTGFPR